MCGNGDFETLDYKVKITINITNIGSAYLESKILFLAIIKNGLYVAPPNVNLEHIDIRERDPIEGERVIIVSPSSDLTDSKLVISYLERKGNEKLQQFSIFPAGPPGYLPSTVKFTLEKILDVKYISIWKI
jgi:hypothetical protein